MTTQKQKAVLFPFDYAQGEKRAAFVLIPLKNLY
jgi:hypothetical protein